MKNYYLLLFLFVLFYSSNVKGQFVAPSIKDAQKVKDMTLAVVIHEKNEKKLKWLRKKDPEKLKVYTDSIDALNKYLKEAIEDEWTLSKKVIFITKSEADKLKKDKNEQYCLLEEVNENNHLTFDHGTSIHRPDDLPAVAIIWARKPNREIVSSYLPYLGLSLGTVTYMVQHLQHQLRNAIDHEVRKGSHLKKEIDKRSYELKNKTLLLFDPLMSKGLKKHLSKNKLDKFYDYNFKVVNYSQVEKAIIENNDNFAYILTGPNGVYEGIIYFIINAGDGRILYMTGRGVAGAKGKFHYVHLTMANKKIGK